MLVANNKDIEDVFCGQEHLEAACSNFWFSSERYLGRRQQTTQNCEIPHNNTLNMLASSVMNNIKVMGEMELNKATVSFSSRFLLAFETALENKDTFKPPSDPPRSSRPSLQFHRCPKSSPVVTPPFDTTPATDDESMLVPHPLPEFIEHAYKFFVANIHNPYPSREEKQIIVDASNSSRVTLTSVSNWFTNARRRCGWAEILKSRCKGNREEMIDISKRVFIKEDPDRPVDPQIVTEFMKMKKNVETMYEKKTRTSAWIEDLDQLASAFSSDEHLECQSTGRQGKRKIQTETLCKTDEAPRRIGRESQNSLSRTASLSSFTSSGSTLEDEESAFGLISIDDKRMTSLEDSGLLCLRGFSPAPSLSSLSGSFDNNRVPSLSWSESEDEERPHKRLRSNANTSVSSASLRSEPSFSLNDSVSSNPSHLPTVSPIVPTCGQKRSYPSFDISATQTAKRIRLDSNQATKDTLTLANIDSLLTLGSEQPQPVEIVPPDTSVPLEVGIFDWSNPLCSFDLTRDLGINVDSTLGGENALSDFSELFQLITSTSVVSDNLIISSSPNNTNINAGIGNSQSGSELILEQPPYAPSPSLSTPDLQAELSSFNLMSLWPQNENSPFGTADVTGGSILDSSSRTSSPVAMQTPDEFELEYLTQAPTQEPILRSISDALLDPSFQPSPSMTPTCTPMSVLQGPATRVVMSLSDVVPSSLDRKKDLAFDLTGKDLTMVEKALRREYKRRELEEKKAALEKELEELERQ